MVRMALGESSLKLTCLDLAFMASLKYKTPAVENFTISAYLPAFFLVHKMKSIISLTSRTYEQFNTMGECVPSETCISSGVITARELIPKYRIFVHRK